MTPCSHDSGQVKQEYPAMQRIGIHGFHEARAVAHLASVAVAYNVFILERLTKRVIAAETQRTQR